METEQHYGPAHDLCRDYVIKERERARDLLAGIVSLSLALSEEPDFARLLAKIVQGAMAFSRADAGALYLVNENGQLDFVMVRSDSQGIALGGPGDEPLSPPWLPQCEGEADLAGCRDVAVRAAIAGRSINIADLSESGAQVLSVLSAIGAAPDYEAVSVLAIPFKNRAGQVIGVLELLNAQDDHGHVIPFDPGFEQMLVQAARLASVALESFRREQALRRQLAALHIVLDDEQQANRLSEITATPYFQQLRAGANSLRQIINGD